MQLEWTASEITQIIEKIMKEKNKTSLSAEEISMLLIQVLEGIGKGSKNPEDSETGLSAGEISNLWTQYIGDSLSICVYTYFLNFVQDQEIKEIMQIALEESQNHISQITEIFKNANFKLPLGLTEKDVHPNTPRLFSDNFLLYYTEIMSIHGMVAYSLAITTSGRKEIRDHFFRSATNATKLFNKTVDLFQARGIYAASPQIPSLKKIEFVENKGIISSFFGDPRPLNATEINNIFFNLKKSIFGKGISLAFSQVAHSEEVRHFLVKVSETTEKHIKIFHTYLEKDNLPSPHLWDNEITNSTVSPFSDKLIMYHIGFLINSAIAYYGVGMASTLRVDIIKAYSETIIDIMEIGNEWMTLMTKNKWLEMQPEAIDRKKLAHIKR